MRSKQVPQLFQQQVKSLKAMQEGLQAVRGEVKKLLSGLVWGSKKVWDVECLFHAFFNGFIGFHVLFIGFQYGLQPTFSAFPSFSYDFTRL